MKKFLSVALIALSFSAFSQVKLGHINSQELIRQMPEYDSAQQIVTNIAKEIEAELLSIQTELQNKYSEFQANQNQWTDFVKQARTKSIQELEARFEEQQKLAQENLQAEQTKYLQPVIDKAREAIAAVAKEQKYTYILDSSVGVLLYFGESDNIMNEVKKKLGLK